MHRVVAASSFSVSLILASSAYATRVDVVRPPPNDSRLVGATARLVAELEASGYEVGWASGRPGDDPRTEVDGAADASPPTSAATLSIRTGAGGAAVEVWVADRLTRKTLVRRIDVPSPTAEIAAVRAVELLRASLLELQLAPTPTSVAPVEAAAPRLAAPSPAPVVDRGTPATWQAGAGFGFLPAHGGVRGTLFPLLSVERHFPVGAFVGVRAAGLTHTSTETTVAGDADLRQALATAQTGFVRPVLGARLHLGVVGGVGAYQLAARGRPVPPNVGRDESVWSLTGSLGATVGAPLGRTLRAFVAGEALALFPRAEVRVGDRVFAGERAICVFSAGFRAVL